MQDEKKPLKKADWTWLKTLLKDFANYRGHKHEAQYLEEIPKGAWVSWITYDDSSVRCMGSGAHKLGMPGVVDPFATPYEQQAQAKKQGVGVRDGFDIDAQGKDYTRCTKCHKHVVPVLHLQPGVTFTHLYRS